MVNTDVSSEERPARTHPKTPFEQWMVEQELPIVSDYAVEDVRNVKRAPWEALGADAAFLQLHGMEHFTAMFVAELEAGKATRPQKHVYEQVVYVLQGSGEAEIWAPDSKAAEGVTFQWQANSLFAIPLNCWYSLKSTGGVPAIFLAINDAPMMLDLFHDREFIFDNPYYFGSRFEPSDNWSSVQERVMSRRGTLLLRANIIPDIVNTEIDLDERRGNGSRITAYEMAGNTLAGHLAEWPPDRYQKAHHHQGGAVLLIVQSEGYSLMWPSQAGPRPYEEGNEDKVVRVDWRPGSVFSPPSAWFHQHFNTGADPAKQVAVRFGSSDHPVGFRGFRQAANANIVPTRTSYKKGGTAIEYEDEDPQIQKNYEAFIAARGR
jgi:mannose-6-phosphate isomerase-like protein (cupin superfamily)